MSNMTTESVVEGIDHTTENTNYIQSLKYDLEKLLAVDLTPKQKDFHEEEDTYEHESGAVVIVTKKVRDASTDLTENALLNPSSGTIYPGAILKQNQMLAEGLPAPYSFPRAPITIRVDLPGLEEQGVATIKTPSNVSVDLAVQKIVDYWFENLSGKKGFQPAVRAYAESRKAFSKQQIGIDCGFGAQWGKSQATMELKVDSDSQETIVYRAFKQIYYSVLLEEPESAGSLFSKEVKLDDSNTPATEPPGFVRSVDYGRIIIVQMITTGSIKQQEAEATLDYKSTGKRVVADLQEKYESIAKNSSFKAIVLGGGDGGGNSAEVITGNVEKIKDLIKEGITFSKSNPAYPISYTVADLKTRATSQCRLTTKYIETSCQKLIDHTITLKHSGWFVANFHVSWKEYDKQSKKYVPKSWTSGDQTAPYEHMLVFPGDAKEFMIEGKYAVFIRVWKSKFIRYPVLEKDRTIKLENGTMNCSMRGL